MGVEPNFRELRQLVAEIKIAATGRFDELERSVSELMLAQRRPGADTG
jgi:hypothetical protein